MQRARGAAFLLTAAVILATADVPAIAAERPAKPGVPGEADKPPRAKAVFCPKCKTWHPRDVPCPKLPEDRAKKVRCPICGITFRAAAPVRLSSRGGVDRDFCKYPVAARTPVAVVWTCPSCAYTDFCATFPEKADERAKAFALETLKPRLRARLGEGLTVTDDFFAGLAQSDIPDRVKYGFALRLAAVRKPGLPARARAKLAVEGVYACRREFAAPFSVPILAGAEERISRQLVARGAEERDPDTLVAHLKGILRTLREARRENPDPKAAGTEIPVGDEIVLWFRLAICCDRLGEVPVARSCLREVLDRLEKLRSSETAAVLAGLFKAREALLVEEGRFRASAIGFMREALDRGEYGAKDLVPVAYLLGEFLRRQSRPAEALAWYEFALRLPGATGTVGPWVRLHRGHAMFMGVKGLARETKLAEAAAKRAGVALAAKPEPEPEPAPGPTPGPAPGPPKTCEEAMKRIHAAVRAHIRDRGVAPTSLDALVEGGFITREVAGGFKCPETGRAYVYRRPRSLSAGRDFILFHLDPQECPCKRLLYLDGTLGRLKP